MLAFAGAAQAYEILPFDSPPPEFDMSMVPKLPPGAATFVTIDVDRIAAIGPKGILTMKLAPTPPIPPGIEPAAKGIELRLIKPELSDEYHSFTYTGSAPGDPDQIISFVRLHPDGERLALCGFYIVKTAAGRTAKVIGDHFKDLRSYLAIGEQLKIPVNFFSDDSHTPQRADGKFVGTCVDTNVRWDAAYAAAPLALHLEPRPFAYKWVGDKVIPLGPGH